VSFGYLAPDARETRFLALTHGISETPVHVWSTWKEATTHRRRRPVMSEKPIPLPTQPAGFVGDPVSHEDWERLFEEPPDERAIAWVFEPATGRLMWGSCHAEILAREGLQDFRLPDLVVGQVRESGFIDIYDPAPGHPTQLAAIRERVAREYAHLPRP
jgi:hypothetical protein